MPLTADRTTVKEAVAAMLTALRTNLTASPPTVTKPFRAVDEGPPDASQSPRPFLNLWLTEVSPTSTTDGDKALLVTAKLRLVTDVRDADPHPAILDKLAAIEDYFDSLVVNGTTMLEGADGFEDREWTLEYPRGSTGGRLATAECDMTFIVKVERGYNRVPKT